MGYLRRCLPPSLLTPAGTRNPITFPPPTPTPAFPALFQGSAIPLCGITLSPAVVDATMGKMCRQHFVVAHALTTATTYVLQSQNHWETKTTLQRQK